MSRCLFTTIFFSTAPPKAVHRLKTLTLWPRHSFSCGSFIRVASIASKGRFVSRSSNKGKCRWHLLTIHFSWSRWEWARFAGWRVCARLHLLPAKSRGTWFAVQDADADSVALCRSATRVQGGVEANQPDCRRGRSQEAALGAAHFFCQWEVETNFTKLFNFTKLQLFQRLGHPRNSRERHSDVGVARWNCHHLDAHSGDALLRNGLEEISVRHATMQNCYRELDVQWIGSEASLGAEVTGDNGTRSTFDRIYTHKHVHQRDDDQRWLERSSTRSFRWKLQFAKLHRFAQPADGLLSHRLLLAIDDDCRHLLGLVLAASRSNRTANHAGNDDYVDVHHSGIGSR